MSDSESNEEISSPQGDSDAPALRSELLRAKYCDLLVVCAKPQELFAVLRSLQETEILRKRVEDEFRAIESPDGGPGTCAQMFLGAIRVDRVLPGVGVHAGQPTEVRMRVVLACGSRQGPMTCASVTTGLLHALEPRMAAMVGMCAGDKSKFKLLDVAVGSMATHISEGKLTAAGLLSDGMSDRSYEALSAAEAAEVFGCVPEMAYADPQGRERVGWSPKAQSCSFLCGPVVDETGIVWQLATRRSEKAYDMESAAFLSSLQQYKLLQDHAMLPMSSTRPCTPVGVLKGIADFADPASRKDGEAKHAAASVDSSTVGASARSGGAVARPDGTVGRPIAAEELLARGKDVVQYLAVRNAMIALVTLHLPTFATSSAPEFDGRAYAYVRSKEDLGEAKARAELHDAALKAMLFESGAPQYVVSGVRGKRFCSVTTFEQAYALSVKEVLDKVRAKCAEAPQNQQLQELLGELSAPRSKRKIRRLNVGNAVPKVVGAAAPAAEDSLSASETTGGSQAVKRQRSGRKGKSGGP